MNRTHHGGLDGKQGIQVKNAGFTGSDFSAKQP
jgi:hypothetical protein